MTFAELETLWAAVPTPSARGDLEGRAPDGFGTGSPKVHLAVDGDGARHLLISAAPDTVLGKRPKARGLDVALDDLRVGGSEPRRYYDIACSDKTMQENFTVVCHEIVEALEHEPDAPGDTLDAIFARWQWFWGMAPDVLTGEEAVGLFGELWFLEFWLAPIDGAALRTWTGPDSDRHDFKWPAASVEVKATRAAGDGSAEHRISTLDQLDDPEEGDLYLFSLRARPDPIGGNSLNLSVDRIRASLALTPELLQLFDERLGQLGYNPGHRQHYDTPMRVIAEELYRVGQGFPRLTFDSFPEGLPPGVDRIAYTLDLVACSGWRVATAPGAESEALRATLS